MKHYFYILKGQKPVAITSLPEWGKWMEQNNHNRHVDDTMIENIRVSTVFLGLDHNHWGGTPLLFETMIFGGKLDGYQDRYHTWEEAKEGHKKACKLVIDSIALEIFNN